MGLLDRLRRLLGGSRAPAIAPLPAPEAPPAPEPAVAVEAPPSPEPAPPPELAPAAEAPPVEAPVLEPAPAPEPQPARFAWSAPGRGGEVGYALREAVRERLGTARPSPDARPARETWKAFLLDVDLEPDDLAWLARDTLYANPREGDWTKVHLPDGPIGHRVSRIADDATTARLERGARLAYRGANVDPTEGLEGDLFEVTDGPRAGEFVYLGNGSRFGAAVWAASTILVPGGSPGLDDPDLAAELLALMRTVAIEHGAPGLAAVSEPVGEQGSEGHREHGKPHER